MKRIISNLAIAAIAFSSTSLMAQSITVGSNSGLPGATVIIPVNFASGGTAIGAFDVEVSFTNTNFSAASASCAVAAIGQALAQCSGNLAGGVFKISIAGNGTDALTSGLVANLSFTIANAATPGVKVLDAVEATSTCGDIAGNDIGTPPPCTAITYNNGQITVTAGPQPVYGSTPGAGALNVGTVAQGGTDPSTNVVINNTGGAVSTTLTGTCTETADPDTVFSLSGDTGFSVPQAGPTDTVTVSCDSAGSVGPHTGTMSCAHNGSNTTPQLYNLSCTITGPAFTSNPAAGSPLTFTATEQNDPDPTQSISVTNTGGTGTLLDANCTDSVDPDNVFSVANGSIVDLTTAGPAKVVTVTCDTAGSVATHTGTLSCSHNGTNTTPATYALSCEISPPGAAVFASNPVAGATINLTPDPVATGTDVPTKSLVISNAATDPLDQSLQIACDLTGDAPPITQSGIAAGAILIAPGASATAVFDCTTTAVGSYTATYSCGYETTPVLNSVKAFETYATYTVKCDVREPEAVVEPAPASGIPQEALVAPGGSHTFSFVFNETADEGVDGTLESCTLQNGSNYDIIAPVSFPVPIPAGGSVTVQVKGTDPGGVDSFADVLNCAYRNNPLPEIPEGGQGVPAENASWPLNIIVGGDASFRVSKEFTDGDNPTPVDVTISCNTGLPIIQSQTISETQDVNFVVQSFESGELDCTVSEDLALAGYTPTYSADGPPGSSSDADGCYFDEIAGGAEYTCHIVNNADPVEVKIVKDWIVDGIGGDQVDQRFELTLYCDAPIVSVVDGSVVGTDSAKAAGYPSCKPVFVADGAGKPPQKYLSCLDLEGSGDSTFTPQVIPQWPSSHCWVVEHLFDDSVEVDNGCGNLTVSHGQGTSCLVTNTVFFEGIPTLSQYGMAILALLMLGVGMVGFRRFV